MVYGNAWSNGLAFEQQGQYLGLRVYLMHRFKGEEAYRQLAEVRETIEAELGDQLEWDPNPAARDKVIRLERAADLQNRALWPQYMDWLAEKTVAFRRAFGKRLREMDLDSEPTEEIAVEEM